MISIIIDMYLDQPDFVYRKTWQFGILLWWHCWIYTGSTDDMFIL